MQTSLYKITLKDGRVFKIFCANRKQDKDMMSCIIQKKFMGSDIKLVESGIHTMKEFKAIINNIK